MKDFFLPTENNDYHPKLLSKLALYLYLAIILSSNLGLTLLVPKAAHAEINISSLYKYHNEERSKLDLQPLSTNTLLIESANLKAKAMLESDCWSHYCPNGKSPWDFFDEVNYEYIYAGENLAEGFEDTSKLMQAWMNSPTHRANIVNGQFAEMGIGYATGKFQGSENNTIIVVHFGTKDEGNVLNSSLPETGTVDNNIVKFTTPTDLASSNNKLPTFTGITAKDSIVKINISGKIVGQAVTNGETFTYKLTTPLTDGKYYLYGEAYNNKGAYLGASRTISFNIDTVAPVGDINSIYVKSLTLKNNQIIVNIASYIDDVAKLSEKNLNESSLNKDYAKPILSIDKSKLESTNSLIFIMEDNAGNKTEIETPSSTILSSVAEKEKSITLDQKLNDLIPVFGTASIKNTVNWGFLLFLTTLFGIDYTYIKKTGFTNLNRSKSHLNLAAFIILILILIVGVSNGNILTGALR
jgi:hypothetical protein